MGKSGWQADDGFTGVDALANPIQIIEHPSTFEHAQSHTPLLNWKAHKAHALHHEAKHDMKACA